MWVAALDASNYCGRALAGVCDGFAGVWYLNQIGLTTHELLLLPQPKFWRMEAAVKTIQMMRDGRFGFVRSKARVERKRPA